MDKLIGFNIGKRVNCMPIIDISNIEDCILGVCNHRISDGLRLKLKGFVSNSIAEFNCIVMVNTMIYEIRVNQLKSNISIAIVNSLN
jgi:hypothetical protein